jgi:serine/threonine protein phosphatase PrpC
MSRFGKAVVEKKQPILEGSAVVLPAVRSRESGDFEASSSGDSLLELEKSRAGTDSLNCFVEVEHYSVQNWGGRHGNEDRVMTHSDTMPNSSLSFHTLGVLDGHDTEVASDLASRLLPVELAKLLKRGCPVTEAYTRAMKTVEEKLKDVTSSAGTCVLSCTIAGNSLWCANLGDCRAILVPLAVPYRPGTRSPSKGASQEVSLPGGAATRVPPTKGVMKPKVLGMTWMSEDQKASKPAEKLRIRKAGGQILDGRVAGLEPSRTLGDFDVKAAVAKGVISIVPEVRRHEFVPDASTPAQAVLVCACDGVWDVLSGQDICDLITARTEICDLQIEMAARSWAPDRGVLQVLAKDLVEFSVAKGSKDDCTAVVAMISVPGDSAACATPSNASSAAGDGDRPLLFGRMGVGIVNPPEKTGGSQ